MLFKTIFSWLIVYLTISHLLFPAIVTALLILLIFILGVVQMAKKLTAGVLQGTSYAETMTVEWQGEEFEVEIKPLNNSQASEVEALMQEGITMKGKPGMKGKVERHMDFDTKKNLFGRNRSDIKAVALGTTDESLTEQVVESEFPPKLVKEIAERIKQITGISNKKEVEDFNEGVENPSDADREQ